MAKEFVFFVYLVESYARYKGLDAETILRIWKERGVVDLIYRMYPYYHVEVLQNAFDDIDDVLRRGRD